MELKEKEFKQIHHVSIDSKPTNSEIKLNLSKVKQKDKNKVLQQNINKDVIFYANSKVSNENTKLDSDETKCVSQTVTEIVIEKAKTKDYQLNLKSNVGCEIGISSCMNKCLKEHRQMLTQNRIVIYEAKFLCTLCKRKIDTLHNTLQHIQGKFHTNKLKLQGKDSSTHIIEHTTCTTSNTHTSTNLKRNTNSNVHSTNLLQNNTHKEKHSVSNGKVEINEMKNESNNSMPFNIYLYCCELCNTHIDIENLDEHVNTVTHKCNIPLFKCFCCKSIIQGTISLTDHLNSKKHLNNLINFLKFFKTNNEIFIQIPNDTQHMLKDTKFSLCSVLLPEIGKEPMHLFEKGLILLDISNMVCNNIKNRIIYSCSICRVTLNTDHNLIEHCKARMHIWRIKQLFSIKKHSNTDMSKKYIITTADDHFDITNDINAEITEVLRVSPFKSNSVMNRAHKEEKVIKRLNKIYCERYLEIEEKMFTVDKKKLVKIELNFKLFVPYDVKTFYCLACNITVSKELDLLYEHACLKQHKINVNKIQVDVISKKLLKQYMQNISKESIKCYICKSCIANDNNSIDAHINDKIHKKRHGKFNSTMSDIFNSITQNLSNLWYSINKFSCVLCAKNFKYKIEFIEHIITQHHRTWKNQIFDFCIPCATLWLDKVDCYTEHCNDIVHKYLIKNKDFMIENFPDCIKKLLKQADKTCDILFQETQILVNDNIQEEVIKSLENALKFCPLFSSIKAFLFGSRITGLGFKDSDIDIFLDCGYTYYQKEAERLKKKHFKCIEQILCKQKEEWEVQEVIEESRTPIIKLLYKRTGVQCDISITNGLSVENSKLIRSFNVAYPSCRKLILFIKKWLSCFNLPARHGLTNYAIAWLVIFYLQLELYLPSVATLIKEKNESRLICGWETGVAQPKKFNMPMKSISLLLLGFFQYYANFDYQHYIICPLMGCTLSKKDFVKLDMLPKEMKPYINHINKSTNPEYFRIDSPLCVQDPFDLSHNVTKSVSSITLKYFKQYCQHSASTLDIIMK